MDTELCGSAFVINIELLEGKIQIKKYAINNLLMLFRNTVMKAMQVFDPDGVAVRNKRKLQRREYFSKV